MRAMKRRAGDSALGPFERDFFLAELIARDCF
jgi:hypothetical protein